MTCNSTRVSAIKSMISRGGIYVTIYNAMPCTGDNTYVNDELYQFDYELNGNNLITLTGMTSIIGAETDWTPTGVYAISGSVVVTDATGVSGYIENSDYTIDYDLAIITRLTTGDIADLGIVRVSYNWHFECIDEKTGNPNRFCQTCLDSEQGDYPTGVIYYQSTTLKALFKIPNYDSDLGKMGFWKNGDGFLSLPIDVEINAENKSDGGFFCMDKIKIHNVDGVWKVMSQPQSIQMGQFLGKRIHVRKLDF